MVRWEDREEEEGQMRDVVWINCLQFKDQLLVIEIDWLKRNALRVGHHHYPHLHPCGESCLLHPPY